VSHQILQQHRTHLLQHVSKCFTFSVSTPSCDCTIIISKTKPKKTKSILSFVVRTPCELKQFEVFPHVTHFLLISTVFLVQWNLNGIKFTFLMISRYFCSTKTLTLTLSIFWTDQSEWERRRQAIQPLLKHQPLEIQNIELRPGACFSKVPKFFGRISGDIIIFVSSKRSRLKARNFAVIFIFIPFTTYEKTSFTE